ncbi:MAG TPA: glycosyltransferase, partial [Acidimicrobiia bacterium]|nr:glycosyltransferase [Acidimicrobiia bacterium]
RVARNLRAIRVALTSHWDVMVIHDPELMICGVLARLLRRRPVVYDVHEDVPASAFTRAWVPRLLRTPLSLVLKGLLRIVEPVLTITLAESGYRYLFAKSHPTFPNYPDTTNYPAAGIAGDGPVVYLGDVTKERGADVAVAACSDLGVPLRLIGGISPETRAYLVSRSTLGDQMRIDGLLPNERAIEALTEASVGLAPLRDLPNYRHSQPTKILEYLAVGLPVVASDLPGTRELVEGLDAVFLVPPGRPELFAGAISQAREPEVAAAARAQAAGVRSRFSWPVDEVRDFYRSLL